MNQDHDPFEPEPEERAKDLRFFSTWPEKLMGSWLRNRRRGGYKFRRQHPFGECVLDFFCDEAMLAIEIDGSQHGHPSEQQRDMARTKFLEKCGVRGLGVFVYLCVWGGGGRRSERNECVGSRTPR